MLVLATFIIILSSCNKEELADPTKELDTYVAYWQDFAFDNMYKMLSPETQATYSGEDYIDRYEKIYHDLQINDLTVTYDALTEDDITAANETGEITIPLHVSMDSIAGEITFSEDITLHLHTDEDAEQKTWYIEWHPGLIFPELKDGGKITVQKEEPRRGEILDRNQMPLAINDIAYEVGVVPNQFQNEEAEKEKIASLLKLSRKALDEKLNASWVQPDFFVPLRIVPGWDESTLNQLRALPSVVTRETIGRTYPSGEAAAHLVGYIGQVTAEELKELKDKNYSEDDMIGKQGLEKIYEDVLRGEEGVKIIVEKEDANGKQESIVIAEKPVKHGEHIQLTIDINLQEKIYKAYEDELTGTTAAINPKTGEILALVSSPAYDPNELTYGVTQSRWDTLMNDARKPFVNRFAATYAPGSVIKPIIAAIGLKNGSITHDEGIPIQGLTWKKDNWKDFHITRVSTSSKPVDLKDALVRSDNIYFAMKAIEMGDKSLVSGLRDYQFGEKIPLQFPIGISQISNSDTLSDEILRANTAYGQGEIEITSLHIALMYSSFVNEGNMIKPVLLSSDQTGEYWVENLLSKEDAQKMQTYLRAVVTDGTARAIDDEDLQIAGKTGTVELKQTYDAKGHENGWFVGYPSKKQDILIAMLIEHTEDKGTSGFVAKKVKEIMEAYYEQ